MCSFEWIDDEYSGKKLEIDTSQKLNQFFFSRRDRDWSLWNLWWNDKLNHFKTTYRRTASTSHCQLLPRRGQKRWNTRTICSSLRSANKITAACSFASPWNEDTPNSGRVARNARNICQIRILAAVFSALRFWYTSSWPRFTTMFYRFDYGRKKTETLTRGDHFAKGTLLRILPRRSSRQQIQKKSVAKVLAFEGPLRPSLPLSRFRTRLLSLFSL